MTNSYGNLYRKNPYKDLISKCKHDRIVYCKKCYEELTPEEKNPQSDSLYESEYTNE